MYRHRFKRHNEWDCCPMGTVRGNGVIECYYFGLITVEYCNNCERRKHNQKIKKGE